MRVISGKVRGKKLYSLEGEHTRPTLDRIKESLFNIIQFKIKNGIILDLFAGSGSLGIECLSRGAKKVIFCDNSISAIKIINQNLKSTKFTNQAIVINKDYILGLKKVAKEFKKFDIIFLDPPYKTDFIIKALEQIVELDLLNKDGMIIVETDNENIEKQILENEDIEIFDTRKYGRVRLIFIGKS